MDNLPELRDIHLPEVGILAFPPAYGWWVLLGLFLATLAIYELVLLFLRKSKKRYALKLLDEYPQNSINAAVQMSELLRRVCVLKYKDAVSFYGEEWIDFLNQHSFQKMDKKTSKLILDAPYIRADSAAYTSDDIAELHSFCKSWIGENL